MATKANKTVKVEDSKSVNNAVENFDAPVMDERIVKINELKAVKMAAISSKKRPAVKEAKELATYILNNWDNKNELCSLPIFELKEINEIIASRIKDLMILSGEIKISSSKAPKDKTEKKETKKEAPAKSEKAPTKKEAKKADKGERTKDKPAKTARKVGDVHPNHPTWIWTEYAEGKFDWRINPQDKQKVGAKAKSDEPKPTKKVKKEAKPKEVKHVTIEEFLEQSKGALKSQLSKTQKESLKLIQKGWRIVDINGTYFFKSSDGQNKSCNMDSVNALMKRMKIDYIPTGLIVK